MIAYILSGIAVCLMILMMTSLGKAALELIGYGLAFLIEKLSGAEQANKFMAWYRRFLSL